MIYVTREHFYVFIRDEIAVLHVGASAQCPVPQDREADVQGGDGGGEGLFSAG